MSTRRDRRKSHLAAEASARFGQLMELIRERALLSTYGPLMLRDYADKLAPDDLAMLKAKLAERTADLHDQIRSFGPDDRVRTLAEAWLVIESAEN